MHPFLHFELCYYQAIDWAIAHRLARVEAGAQGEHKIARGYLPTAVYSAHYIADPALRRAIADYLVRERAYVAAAGAELAALAPFRKDLALGSGRLDRDLSISAQTAESTMPSYDPNNIFAKILRGELPAHKVYEDDKALRLPRHHAARAGPHPGHARKPLPATSSTLRPTISPT